MNLAETPIHRFIVPALFALSLLPTTAVAQTPAERIDPLTSKRLNVGKLLANFFLSNGAYVLTNRSGRDAFGDVKFYNPVMFFGRPKHLNNNLTLTGGFEVLSGSSNFLFGNEHNGFTLLGPAARLSVPREKYQIRPYLETGLYLGTFTSDRLGKSRTAFAPGMELGTDFQIGRYVVLSAGYRIHANIAGVNTDGFQVNLRLF